MEIKLVNKSGKVIIVDSNKAKVLTKHGIWSVFTGAVPVDAVVGAEMVEAERVKLIAKIDKFEAEKAAFEAEKLAFYADKNKLDVEVETSEPSKRGRKPKTENV